MSEKPALQRKLWTVIYRVNYARKKFFDLFKNFKNKIIRWLHAFGLDVFTAKRAVKGFFRLFRDYRKFKGLSQRNENDFSLTLNYPCLADYYQQAGIASGHYFHQDLLVAQKIYERKPDHHIDVGSRIDGFVAHLASFREVEVLDIRPISEKVSNMVFRRFDLTNPLKDFISYCDSLSCLHTLEHLGLGRYGDPLAVNGYITGFETLHSILRLGGVYTYPQKLDHELR